jgi:hypothetical protein
MPWIRPRALVNGLALLALAGAGLIAGGAPAAQAASGYGPPPPSPPVPGGYFVVVTSVTVGPKGGKIGPVKVHGARVTLIVPAGAFPGKVQITLTAPSLTGIGDGGRTGYHAVGGVGILVQRHGTRYPGTFLKPLSLTISASSIKPSSIVVVWNRTRFVTVPGARVQRGSVRLSFDSDPDYAVLAPLAPIRGATRAATGEPLLGEGVLAGALVLLGAGGLAYSRRRAAR